MEGLQLRPWEMGTREMLRLAMRSEDVDMVKRVLDDLPEDDEWHLLMDSSEDVSDLRIRRLFGLDERQRPSSTVQMSRRFPKLNEAVEGIVLQEAAGALQEKSELTSSGAARVT